MTVNLSTLVAEIDASAYSLGADKKAVADHSIFTIRELKTVWLHTAFAKISPEGEVHIDWAATEAAAVDASDSVSKSLAQLALAIRDGTWKPIE